MDSTIPAPQLPVDIWLLVFDYIDLRILWDTCRGVSHYLRACVDEYFRHGTLQNTFVDLHYADIHMRRGPVYNYVHVPMVFDRLADGGKRAVFRQKVYKEMGGCKYPGTIRGWVPFIQRYCAESQKPKPKVLNKAKSDASGPLWEQEHLHWRNTLSGDRKKNYLQDLGNMTSIGRGDRPPFYLKILDRVNDTELVDVVIDCKSREISFDWSASFSLFFREVSFAVRAHDISGKARVYDEDLVAATSRYFPDMDRYTNATRARHKRLQPWVAKNKKRMSPEVRLWTERRFDAEKARLAHSLRHDNLRDMDEHDMLIEKDELVPEKLADDHFDLLFWPWTRDDTFFVPVNHFGSRLKCCNIL